MNPSLRVKLLLSYIAVIVLTLFLLSWFLDTQIGEHFESFYQALNLVGLQPPPDFILSDRHNVFLEAVQNSIVFTAFGAGATVIVLSFFIVGYITRPIHRLIAATKAIAKGNYEERVPIESDDELGDLTESLNSMAMALENNRYLQRQLITNMAHELATPLTNIGGYLEALTDKVIDGPQDREEALILMKEETDRLKTMLDEVRSLAMVEEPHFKIHPKPLNVKELTARVVKHIRPQFDQKKVKLSFHSTLKSEMANLDKDRYTQILLNILNNALKYTPPEKGVFVELRTESDPDAGSPPALIVEIRDEGEGIPAKDLPYIFERFYRSDASRTRSTGGLGVGLAIVKELVEAHGGTISVQSEKGKGTSFICRLKASGK